MQESDRRHTPRFDLRIPLSIQPLDSSGTPTKQVVSSNISSRGVYFATDLPLRVGTPLQMTLRMPEEVVGKPSREWCCSGRVVRVHPNGSSHDKLGIGVVIDWYEVLSA